MNKQIIVYKYRNWKNGFHRNILLHNEIYLASPKEFNDPFDCRISENFSSLSEEQLVTYFSIISNRENGTKDKVVDPYKIYSDRNSIQNHRDLINFQNQDTYYGILSLGLSWHSILNWSHYAECHRGFCVGFDLKKLQETGFFHKGDKVCYVQNYPCIVPKADKTNEESRENAFIKTHTKAKDWEREEEYRLLRHFLPNKPLDSDRLIKITDSVFAEVILGICISDDDKKEIIRICKNKNIPVYQAKKKEFKFEIDRELIC